MTVDIPFLIFLLTPDYDEGRRSLHALFGGAVLAGTAGTEREDVFENLTACSVLTSSMYS